MGKLGIGEPELEEESETDSEEEDEEEEPVDLTVTKRSTLLLKSSIGGISSFRKGQQGSQLTLELAKV